MIAKPVRCDLARMFYFLFFLSTRIMAFEERYIDVYRPVMRRARETGNMSVSQSTFPEKKKKGNL